MIPYKNPEIVSKQIQKRIMPGDISAPTSKAYRNCSKKRRFLEKEKIKNLKTSIINLNQIFNLYAFILFTSTIVPGVNQVVVLTHPLHLPDSRVCVVARYVYRIDEIHMLDIECFTFLNVRKLPSEVVQTIVRAMQITLSNPGAACTCVCAGYEILYAVVQPMTSLSILLCHT